MIRSTTYPRIGKKLGITYSSINPVIPPAPAPTWYGTNTKGFSVGGTTGPVVTADKATFSSETTAAQTSANLTAARAQLAGGGNDTIGYFIGGTDSTDTSQTSANKITYSNDTTATNASAVLPSARSGIMAAMYSTAIYMYGGSAASNSNDQTAAYKTLFSNDTTSALTSANLSTGRASGATLSSDTAAIYLGGFRNTPSSFTRQTLADKMPFSTETTANNASLALPTAKAYANYGSVNGTLNSFGYMTGDQVTFTWTKASYATDTCANMTATYGAANSQQTGISSTTTAYTLGGYTTTQAVTSWKMPFSTEVLATITAMNKSVAKAQTVGVC